MNTDETLSITYQAELPISWQKIAPPSLSTLALWRQSNLDLLRGLATLEALVPAENEHEASPVAAKALERVEAKLDIMLGMLARLVTEKTELPPILPVELGASSLAWHAPDRSALELGQEILIQLFLSPRLPEPLKLWVRITSAQFEAEETGYTAELLDTDTELDEWLTRTLFRYHRRALQARHHAA